MLYRALRPLLFQLDPERAHRIALRAMSSLARRPGLARFVHRTLARPARFPVEALGLCFPNPIGLAAGFDKDGEAPLAWWALGFGFIELGTVTPRPQPGNPRPRMFRDPARGALINRMGFNNIGADEVVARLDEMERAGRRPPIPIGISVGKNKDTPLERAADDYRDAAAVLAPHADFLTINVSSPNTPGLRELQQAESIHAIVASVRIAAPAKPVLIKIAPELSGELLKEVLDAALAAGVSGVIATNTLSTAETPGVEPGGLSGRPLHATAVARVREIIARVGSAVAVIGCGGIDDADSCRAFLDAGARLVQLYTGLVYRGPFLAARLSRALAMSETQSAPAH
jgi:dihydroorotate dehydrogenase